MAIQNIINKNVVAFANIDDFFPNTCLVYPRYVVNAGGKVEKLNEWDFPDWGAVHMNIRGLDSTELGEMFDDIFVMKFKPTALKEREGANKLYCNFRLDLNNGPGEVQIKTLDKAGYMQVGSIPESIEALDKNRTIENEGFYTKNVFLKSKLDGYYYGPFALGERSGSKIHVRAIDIYDYKIGKFSKESIKDYTMAVSTANNESTSYFISDFDGLNPLAFAVDTFDFVEPDDLIDQIADMLKISGNDEGVFSRDEIKLIKSRLTESMEKVSSTRLSNSRKTKMLEYIDNLENTEASFRETLLNEVMKSKDNRKILLADLIENKEIGNFVVELFDEDETRNQILDYQKKAGIVVNIGADKNKALESENDKLKAEIEKLKQELESTNNKQAEPVGVSNVAIKDIAKYQNKCKEAQDSYIKWQEYADVAKDTLNNTLKEFKAETKVLSQVLNQSVLNDILQGGINDVRVENELKVEAFDTNILSKSASAEAFIKQIYNYMDKANRPMSEDEIINLLTCISNGFITTFAGAPGTGKTSLCNILANALGLARDDHNRRFTQVAVERGWSSHKDYIGYYNPLSQTYEKSNAELFDAIVKMHKETEAGANIAPYLVLLDEANLSPIEHYWSVFNRNCDLTIRDRSISLGGEDVWKLSPDLRFLATINFDHTTEELSPRFLDRTWVIMLDPKNMDVDMDEVDYENADSILGMESMSKWFTPNVEDRLSNVLKNKFASIKRVFEDNDIALSPRSIKMVSDYCKVAEKYMERDSANPFKALDFAVSQKILPTINGYGKKYDALCTQLAVELEKMPLSKRILEMICDNNEENGTYQLF